MIDSSHPQPSFKVHGIKQRNDIAMATGSNDVNLSDVILQLLLTMNADHFSRG